MKTMLLALCALLLPALAGAVERDAGRRVSDSVADDLVFNRRPELYQKAALIVRDNMTEAEFSAGLEALNAIMGRLQAFSFKKAMAGSTMVAGKTFATRRYWYLVVTSLHPTGHYLFVDVTDTELPQTVGFSVVNFPTGAPQELR